MLNTAITATTPAAISVMLDVADKLIKLAAVVLGGFWTYWNFRKSRTYQEKVELRLSGSLYRHGDVFVEISAGMKNLGATKQSVQQQGTSCEMTAIFDDLTEQSLRVFTIFTRDKYVEPGETISDLFLARLGAMPDNMLWLRIDLRVASAGVEWQQSNLIRISAEVAP